MTLQHFLVEKSKELLGTLTETERLSDFNRLACWALSLSPLEFLHQKNQPLNHWTAPQRELLTISIERRLQGEPLSRIQGERGFWKDIFVISPATLDPRPETEGLIDLALTHFPKDFPLSILELGVGSGCLLLSLLREFKHAQGTGIDLSPDALKISHKNAERLGLKDRATFVQGDWCAPLAKNQHFHLIVSNPPYIPSETIEALEREVRDYDPRLALDGGLDGLDAYKNLIPQTIHHLHSDGLLLIEIGIHQAGPIRELLKRFFKNVWMAPDLAGILRYGGANQNQTKLV